MTKPQPSSTLSSAPVPDISAFERTHDQDVLATWLSITTLAAELKATGHLKSPLNLRDLALVPNSIVNMGQIDLQGGNLNSSSLFNHARASLALRESGKIRTDKLKNHGSLVLKNAQTNPASSIQKLVNTGQIDADTNLKIGALQTQSSSQLRFYGDKKIEIASPFQLYGKLYGMNGLNLTGTGQNWGEISLQREGGTSLDRLPFKYKGSALENRGLISSLTPMRISGEGEFHNYKKVEAPKLVIDLPSIKNQGLINGNKILLKSKDLTNSHGDINAVRTTLIVASRIDNSCGKIHVAENLIVRTTALNNQEGSLSGAKGTSVIMEFSQFNNKGGDIGAGGETNLFFDAESEIAELGTIKGNKIYIVDCSPEQNLILHQGVCAATDKISLRGGHFGSTHVNFQTPLLVLHLLSWSLNNQIDCQRTVWRDESDSDLTLAYPYHTRGTLEIWSKGLATRAEAVAKWQSLYGDHTQPLPEPKKKIRLNADIQADQGMKVYAPEAILEIPDTHQEKATELLFPDGSVDLLISKFDLERGILSASSLYSAAPYGHFIGRLVRDLTRDCFATFYCHSQVPTSHGLGDAIHHLTYTVLEQEIENVFSGAHLLTLPVFIKNGTALDLKGDASFTGAVHLRGDITVDNLTINSNHDSQCFGSTLKIRGDLAVKGVGKLLLKRVLGSLTFTYHAYAPFTWDQFVSSDPNDVRVEGRVIVPAGSPIINEGSIFYFGDKSDEACIQSKDITNCLYQQFIGGTLEERKKLSLPATGHWFLDRSITYPSNSHANRGYDNYGAGFLQRTNNFSKAQKVFAAQTSCQNGLVLSGNDTTLEGHTSTPLMLITMGKGKLALGSPNPYYIAPKHPIQDLMEKGFNLQTTYIAPNLKELLANAEQSQIFFKMRERFWFDSEKAQQFYRDIYDHVVIVGPSGLKKLDGPTLFSMSPAFLIDRVRQACQEKLMRGYIYDYQPIDEECVKQLHRNATEYLRQSNRDPVALSQALVSPQSSNPTTLPDKPVLFYQFVSNDEGVEEISPVIAFPISMMNAARSDRGGLISTKVLAIFPDTMTPQQIIESQQDNPEIQNRLLEHFDTNPGTVAHLERQAYDRQQQRLLAPHPQIGGALTPRTGTSTSLSSSQPTEESEFGSVTLDATFRVGQMAILNEGPVLSRADIEAEKVFLASLYDDVILQSKKERLYSTPENFIDRISAQARIHVKEILRIYSGQNVIMVGAQTYSGVLTHIKALADIIDEPLELVTQHVEYHGNGRKKTRIQTNTSTLARGNHSSGREVITDADHNIMFQATTGKAPKFEVVGGHDVHFADAHATTSRQIDSTKKGSFNKTKTHRAVEGSSTSVGVHFEADEIHTTALKGNITATNPTFAALETNLRATEGLVEILLGVNSYFCQSIKSSNSVAWNRVRQRTKEDTTYAQPTFTGTVNINSRETLVQLTEGQANEFFAHIKQHGGALETRFLKELHRSEHKMVQGPGQALISLVALALSMVTGGAGAVLLSGTSLATNAAAIAMIDVAVTQVASQLTIGTAQNGGNALKGVKTLLNKDFLKNLAVSVASAGVAAELGSSLKIKKPDANFVKSATNPTLLAAQLKYTALQEGVKVGVKSTLGGQSLKRNFREGAKNTVVDTAAGFAANKAGQYYAQDTVGYVGNKAMHFGIGFGLGYAVSTGDRVQDGLTAGSAAVAAEVTAEALGKGPGEGGGDASGDAAAKRLRRAADWGRFAAACAAFATGRDVDIAIRSATNAVENNFLTSTDPDDLFAEVLKNNLEEEQEPEIGKQGVEQKTEKTRPTLKKSLSDTNLKQQYEIGVVESVEQDFKEHTLNSNSVWDKILYWASYAVADVEGTSASQAHYARYGMRRAGVDGVKVGKEGAELLYDKMQGRSIDDSRLDAYKQLCDDWGPHATGFLGGFVGGGKGGKGRAPGATNRNRHHFQGPPTTFKKLSAGANPSHSSFEGKKSASAIRLHEDMRAVVNGSASGRSSSSAVGMSSSSSKGTGALSAQKLGTPHHMPTEQWLHKSNMGQTLARSAKASEPTVKSQGSSAAHVKTNGQTTKLGNTLDGRREGKGKEREGLPRDADSSASGTTTKPNISKDHDRIAHDGYYNRKNQRTEQHNWQQQIKNAQPADYKKHTRARTAEEARRMSETGRKEAQYLPGIDNKNLEKIALRSPIRVEKSNGTTYCFYKSDKVVGYDNGKPTQWIRAELTSGKEFHGHPVSLERLKMFLGKVPQ